MKKFLSYSLIATVLIVVIGALFIFGTFDLNVGQTNTIGSGQVSIDFVKTHNEIVDTIHDLAILSTDAKNFYNELNPESNLNDLKNHIQTINDKKDKLKSIFDNENFKKQQSKTAELFKNEYLPTVETLCNTFLKAISYFEEKEYTQESIDSFKGVLNTSEQKLQEAHNNFVEDLNTHKH